MIQQPFRTDVELLLGLDEQIILACEVEVTPGEPGDRWNPPWPPEIDVTRVDAYWRNPETGTPELLNGSRRDWIDWVFPDVEEQFRDRLFDEAIDRLCEREAS